MGMTFALNIISVILHIFVFNSEQWMNLKRSLGTFRKFNSWSQKSGQHCSFAVTEDCVLTKFCWTHSANENLRLI